MRLMIGWCNFVRFLRHLQISVASKKPERKKPKLILSDVLHFKIFENNFLNQKGTKRPLKNYIMFKNWL